MGFYTIGCSTLIITIGLFSAFLISFVSSLTIGWKNPKLYSNFYLLSTYGNSCFIYYYLSVFGCIDFRGD